MTNTVLSPLILAIETSAEVCSCALSLTGGTFIERVSLEPRDHAQRLLPFIDSLLKEAGLNLQDIDALACSRGPGSFTGIRIGTSLIQGLSFGLSKPVILISTLRAMAETCHRLTGATHVMASIDAQKQEVYWAQFEVDDKNIMQATSEEYLEKSEVYLEKVEAMRVSWESGEKTYHYTTTETQAQARDVLTLAKAEFGAGKVVTAELVAPVYLKNQIVSKR